MHPPRSRCTLPVPFISRSPTLLHSPVYDPAPPFRSPPLLPGPFISISPNLTNFQALTDVLTSR